MTQALLERIDYEVSGGGETIVLVPGSCSTAAVWRDMISAWGGQFRCVTTSLLGYGGTAERRTENDTSISHEADALEWVVRKASSGRIHLVGHSFGGLVAVAVALRVRARLASLVVIEAPAVELLRERGEQQHYDAFRRMTEAYFSAYAAGNAEAIATMVDFYGGAGTFASWPERVRNYAVKTTPVNIRDWASAYGFRLSAAALAAIEIPTLVLRGEASHPAIQRANGLLAAYMGRADLATIGGAAHFMLATHAREVARLVAEHVHRAGSLGSPAHAGSYDDEKPEETMTWTQGIQPAGSARSWSGSNGPIPCPITGYPCMGDLSHLCRDYGCARKGGLSPRSDENF